MKMLLLLLIVFCQLLIKTIPKAASIKNNKNE